MNTKALLKGGAFVFLDVGIPFFKRKREKTNISSYWIISQENYATVKTS
jgi:hypothetical protein